MSLSPSPSWSAAGAAGVASRWLEAVVGGPVRRPAGPGPVLVGVLPGEGVGPEVTRVAVEVLAAVCEVTGTRLETETGGCIGCDAEARGGVPLPEDVVAFCQSVLARGGAILNGPGGSRYVYDLRKALDLFFKISPIQPCPELRGRSPLRPEVLEGVDLLVVRENISGVYQGQPEACTEADGGRTARHTFAYTEAEVSRFLEAAARLAAVRRGRLTVAYKHHGIRTVSALWQDCAAAAAAAAGVRHRMVDVDLLAYQLISEPGAFDVMAAPNMCGDVLADLAAALLGTRAMSFSGNYTPEGAGVYQTNHGAAYDLAGTDTASPVGQILSLAMMCRHSLGLPGEAAAVEEGVRAVWRAGWCTAEAARGHGGRVAGTRQMGELVARAAAEAARALKSPTPAAA